MADQLAWPARIDPATGALATVDRDSDAGTAQAVRLTIASRPGERLQAATFGIPGPTYIGLDSPIVLAAIEEWVPRADVTIDAGEIGNGRQDVTITVTRKRT